MRISSSKRAYETGNHEQNIGKILPFSGSLNSRYFDPSTSYDHRLANPTQLLSAAKQKKSMISGKDIKRKRYIYTNSIMYNHIFLYVLKTQLVPSLLFITG